MKLIVSLLVVSLFFLGCQNTEQNIEYNNEYCSKNPTDAENCVCEEWRDINKTYVNDTIYENCCEKTESIMGGINYGLICYRFGEVWNRPLCINNLTYSKIDKTCTKAREKTLCEIEANITIGTAQI